MKKLLLILLCLPLVFVSCKKTECNCGYIRETGSIDNPNGSGYLWYLYVTNECTSNRDTFFISRAVFNYYENEKHYCTGVW